MKFKVTSFEPRQAINIKHRKENSLNRAFVAIDKAGSVIAECRIYWPGTVAYACLWVHYTNNSYANGSGQAGGYGYDKPSAAASEAFGKAGIQLDKSFNATGCTREAMEALGRHLAKRKFLTVLEVYG